MGKFSSLACLSMGMVGVMLVAACSHRKNEQGQSSQVSPSEVLAIDTVSIASASLVPVLQESKSVMSEIISLVTNAPGKSETGSSGSQIVFVLDGSRYTLQAYPDEQQLSVWKRPVGSSGEQVLDSWSFRSDSLISWSMTLPGTKIRTFYRNISSPYYYRMDGDERVELDAEQLKAAKSVEEQIKESQKKLNEFIRKNFGA